jgi:hypothetical protein
MDDIFFVRFLYDDKSVNWFQIIFVGGASDCYYNAVTSGNNDELYYAVKIYPKTWWNYDFNKIFNYNVKILQFDGDEISVMCEKNFDIKKHNFNITLKSEDEKQIRIWKYYLWLIQLKLGVQFNIIVNEDFENQDYGDYVEISRKSYDNYLRKCRHPLTDDYSSLTIIRKVFNIIEDDSEIVNHPWLK